MSMPHHRPLKTGTRRNPDIEPGNRIRLSPWLNRLRMRSLSKKKNVPEKSSRPPRNRTQNRHGLWINFRYRPRKVKPGSMIWICLNR